MIGSFLSYTVTDNLYPRSAPNPPAGRPLLLLHLRRARGLLLQHPVGAAPARTRPTIELRAEGVDEGRVHLFGDGLVVSREGLGGGVLDAQPAGDLGVGRITSLRSPCSWMTLRKKTSLALREILAYLSRFFRNFLKPGPVSTSLLAISNRSRLKYLSRG